MSEWTGNPAERLTRAEQERYAEMDAVLSRRVVGQDEAVRAVSRRMRSVLAGLKAPNRLDDLVKVLILDSAYDPRMGARPLERAVDERIVQPLVDAIFAGQIRAGAVSAVIDGAVVAFRQA
jgi:ATP-dependent Clp protease ATP-binding subunit ClpA